MAPCNTINAADARIASEGAQRVAALRAEEEKAKDKQQQLEQDEREKEYARNIMFPSAMQKIHDAISKGERSVALRTSYQGDKQYTQLARPRTNTLIRLLREQGYAVSYTEERERPDGPNSLIDYITYDVTLHISW